MKKNNTAPWVEGAADLSLAALRSEIDDTDDALTP